MAPESSELMRQLDLCPPLEVTIRTPEMHDFNIERLPLHSPLLGQSLLVSFPPLSNMLKFSGYSCLPQVFTCGWICASAIIQSGPRECDYCFGIADCRTSFNLRSFSGIRLVKLVGHTETNMPKETMAPIAFKDLMTRGFLQFALLIALCCVLHRNGNLDIHRWEWYLDIDLVNSLKGR